MNEPRLKYGAMACHVFIYSQSPVSLPSGIMFIHVNSVDLYGAIYDPIFRLFPNILAEICINKELKIITSYQVFTNGFSMNT